MKTFLLILLVVFVSCQSDKTSNTIPVVDPCKDARKQLQDMRDSAIIIINLEADKLDSEYKINRFVDIDKYNKLVNEYNDAIAKYNSLKIRMNKLQIDCSQHLKLGE
jgi:hypothetical protein